MRANSVIKSEREILSSLFNQERYVKEIVISTMKLLVASQLALPILVRVEKCGKCGARVTHMDAHEIWHALRDKDRRVDYCRAGQHDYVVGKAALHRINCPSHTASEPRGPERKKRMSSTGIERKEVIRAK